MGDITPTRARESTKAEALAQWGADLLALLQAEDASKWAIGDMLVEADNHPEWGEDYYQYIPSHLISHRTAQNRKSLALRFPAEMRRWKLSQRHYDAVRSLTNDAAAELLEDAAAEKLSSDELREIVREFKQTPTTSQTTDAVVEQVRGGWLVRTDLKLDTALAGKPLRVNLKLVNSGKEKAA